ncbi:MAG TPA: class I SAM-dependent methyltransferase [Segeticoccus sp.]|uniref:class I SAM-dependent methyltransferase n=1 Tax=Segeticoccus sp. TaxID=2706531 RepID=UPI002D7F3665|nr:class I SAM-dependent methyltransferase [Segeticoccus sp.]HET8600230.1 class I SAM-dependent methyltransferase [Segeticoccus sp.]
MTIGRAFDQLFGADAPVRFSAYDGSTGGDPGAAISLRLENERGLRYLVTSPGSLGMARAYLMNDLTVEGTHPGDPYDLLKLIEDGFSYRRPTPRELPELARTLGLRSLRVPELPPQETPSQFHRLLNGLRHSKSRDAEAIHHHYDVGNAFYELLLGPSMTYTCACYPTADATLEEAQAGKYDLICRKLDLRPGMRLLDVGCGWGGMVRHAVTHYGVSALGVTLSRDQADWAAKRIAHEGLSDQAEVRFMDYRDVTERGFDAISSIGLTEHIGVKNYPAYFRFLLSRLREGGRLLNHCITRPDNLHPGIPSAGFINRYVFPDGEITGSGQIIRVMQDTGFEVRHEENLREHYAMTCRDWVRNLRENWDEAVALVGEGTAKVWALYLAGSRLSFERNRIQLHQVLGVHVEPDGNAHMPLRPTWAS